MFGSSPPSLSVLICTKGASFTGEASSAPLPWNEMPPAPTCGLHQPLTLTPPDPPPPHTHTLVPARWGSVASASSLVKNEGFEQSQGLRRWDFTCQFKKWGRCGWDCDFLLCQVEIFKKKKKHHQAQRHRKSQGETGHSHSGPFSSPSQPWTSLLQTASDSGLSSGLRTEGWALWGRHVGMGV